MPEMQVGGPSPKGEVVVANGSNIRKIRSGDREDAGFKTAFRSTDLQVRIAVRAG
jgi:hypothetical protein